MRTVRRPVLLVAALTITAGCLQSSDDGDEETSAKPATCAEIREASEETGDPSPDGGYTLFVNGDEAQPWTAYCHQMSTGTPSEWLTVNDELNYSQVTNGTRTVATRFRRFRIDVAALTIDPIDATFATTEGADDAQAPSLPNGLDFVPAGWAEFQAGDLGPPAQAALDLTGTAFAFHSSLIDDPTLPFFCMSSDTSSQPVSATQAALSTSLTEIDLLAHDTDAGYRVVMDCDALGPSFATSAATAAFPLEYP